MATDKHARWASFVGTIQETDEERRRLSEPSAALYASTVCVCKVPPLAPCAMESGPTVDDARRNSGAARRLAAQRRPTAASAAARRWLRPTRETPSYKGIRRRRGIE